MGSTIDITDLLLFMDECGFSLEELQGAKLQVFGLKDACEHAALERLDPLVLPVGGVILTFTCKGRDKQQALRWMTEHSKHLDELPIVALIRGLDQAEEVDRTQSAAEAYIDNVAASQWKVAHPTPSNPPGATVIAFPLGRTRRRR